LSWLISRMIRFAIARVWPASMRFHGSFDGIGAPRAVIFRAAAPSWMVGTWSMPRAASERLVIRDAAP
jgi:hypothetical protein